MARLSRKKKQKQRQLEEQGYISRSQGQMIWQAFRRHRVGNVGTIIVLLFLVVAIFAQFIGPYHYSKQFRKHPFSPPTTVHWRDDDGSLSRPYVFATERTIDMTTYQITYVEDTSKKYYVRFFVSGGSEHRLLGFMSTAHLFAARADDPKPSCSFSGRICWGVTCSRAAWSVAGFLWR